MSKESVKNILEQNIIQKLTKKYNKDNFLYISETELNRKIIDNIETCITNKNLSHKYKINQINNIEKYVIELKIENNFNNKNYKIKIDKREILDAVLINLNRCNKPFYTNSWRLPRFNIYLNNKTYLFYFISSSFLTMLSVFSIDIERRMINVIESLDDLPSSIDESTYTNYLSIISELQSLSLLILINVIYMGLIMYQIMESKNTIIRNYSINQNKKFDILQIIFYICLPIIITMVVVLLLLHYK